LNTLKYFITVAAAIRRWASYHPLNFCKTGSTFRKPGTMRHNKEPLEGEEPGKPHSLAMVKWHDVVLAAMGDQHWARHALKGL
jgi:hypothetical protein